MTPRKSLAPTVLIEALNAGPAASGADPEATTRDDVRAAAELFDVSERTVYRYIAEFGIRQRCSWELPGEVPV